MKFNLEVIKDGVHLNWTFDNVKNEFYNEFNNRIDFIGQPKVDFEYVTPFGRDDFNEPKSTDNNLLEISLGTKCNFECKYCSQKSFKDKSYSCSPNDVAPFIKMLEKSGLQCGRIQLWGGEPFVYWKTIQKLVPELRRLYPEAHLSAPSNGSLLTREKIDFVKKYNMHLFISHDGCGNEKRDSDILDDPIVRDAIEYAYEVLSPDMIAFGATPSHNNTDVIKIIDFFKKKLPNLSDKVRVSTHNIVRCHDSSNNEGVAYSMLTDEDRSIFVDSIFRLLNNEVVLNDYSLEKKLEGVVRGIIDKEPLSAVRAECHIPFANGLIVDLKGNILQCHNHPIQDLSFGNLVDLSSVRTRGYVHFTKKKRCTECLVVHGCKGGCPSADDRANELACPNLYALWYALFKVAVARLFGVLLISATKIKD